MRRSLLLAILLGLLCSQAEGQDVQFLDSLFNCSVTQIHDQVSAYNLSQIDYLKRDYGLSIGAQYFNLISEEQVDQTPGPRFVFRFDVLRNGLVDRRKHAEQIQLEEIIHQEEQREESMVFNGSFYTNYIAYCYAEEKLRLLKKISDQASTLSSEYLVLHHKKMKGVEELLYFNQITAEYDVLTHLNSDLVEIFKYSFDSSELPVLSDFHAPSLDFKELVAAYRQHHLESSTATLKSDVFSLNEERKNLPSLSLTSGVDVLNGRPYVGINFLKRIKGGSQSTERYYQVIETEKESLELYHNLKSLRVIQGDFEFKKKKIEHLSYEKELAQSRLNDLILRDQIADLNLGLTEKQIQLEIDLISLEMWSLNEECMQDLKSIKKIIYPMDISPFLIDSISPKPTKYPYSKFVLLSEGQELTLSEQIMLDKYEYQPIYDEVALPTYYLLLNLSEFESREELETYMSSVHDTSPETCFLVKSVQSIKDLELKTIINHQAITSGVILNIEE